MTRNSDTPVRQEDPSRVERLPQSDWLKLMLEEIGRKTEQAAAAAEERERRRRREQGGRESC